jgi:hypothetical protein
MEKQTLTLKILSQKFNGQNIKTTTYGFVLNYNGKNYIITVHHFLPIYKIFDFETNNELNIEINSSWNEGLILDTENVDLSKYKIFSKIHNSVPKLKSNLSMMINNDRIQLEIIGYDLIPFDNIQMDVPILIIKAKILSDFKNFAGYSGSPVFYENKIVGIYTKLKTDTNVAFIIPIYIIIKNLEKEDNSNIYTVNVKNIRKICTWNVNKDNHIYHPTLKFNIPVNTYFLVEGDINFKTIIHYGKKKIDLIQSELKKDLALDSNSNLIIRNDSEYKLNIRLLSLLKYSNIDPKVLKNIIINLSMKKENWLKITDNILSIL